MQAESSLLSVRGKPGIVTFANIFMKVVYTAGVQGTIVTPNTV
jgi:hypothetical protein